MVTVVVDGAPSEAPVAALKVTEKLRLPEEGARETTPTRREPAVDIDDEELNLKAEMQRYEADLILSVLKKTGWNRQETASVLGVPLRTLAHKMRSHGLRKVYFESELED